MTNWLGVIQLAKHIGVSKETVYRWVKANKIPKYRVGKLWKFDPIEIDKIIKKGLLSESNLVQR